jgi:signal transduction histidine kinase
MVRLADFILSDTEAILAEWEAFARGVWPDDAGADVATLRDHAEDILRAAARDMQADQSAAEQSDKSEGKGRDSAASARLDRASNQHGLGRVESGFDLPSVVAEYRALRASVVRLWRDTGTNPDQHDLDDLTRFNESIDQSLGRAARAYTNRVDQSRQTFLAILGHDLRTPLYAMRMASAVLLREGRIDAGSAEMVSVLDASAKTMNDMVRDLLDFATTGLGGRMPVSPAPADLGRICRDVAGEVRTAHPDCTVDVRAGGDLAGEWDAARLRQAVANLVGNAVKHGDGACRVDVSAAAADGDDHGPAAGVTIAVHNGGPPIPPDLIPTIFEPLVRDGSRESPARRQVGSIGLGLYIARAIVAAHGGTVDVTSSAAAGTSFTLRLPRRTPAREEKGRPD